MALTPFKGRFGRRVSGCGPTDAKVVLLAEAPGADEEDVGEPLVGAAGALLFDGVRGVPPLVWPGLERLGLERRSLRLENVVEVRPLWNDLSTVSLVGMEKAQASTWTRLEALTAMELLVPMGNPALNTVLREPLRRRKKRGGGHEWKWTQAISSWRGSVNRIEIAGRPVTMIPTYHPAKFLYGGDDFQAWRSDWVRIAEAAERGLAVWPEFQRIVAPTRDQLRTFQRLVQHTWHREGTKALLAFDIETVGPIIDCIGFALEGIAVTIPLLPQLWPGRHHDARFAWDVVRALVQHDIPKGTWWGYYDVFRLERQKGMQVKRWWWDGYNMHHLLDPADGHSLDYAASRLLRVPYWKHLNKQERKGPDAALRKDWRTRHDYCARDAGYTWYLIRKMQEMLAGGWEATWDQIEMCC